MMRSGSTASSGTVKAADAQITRPSYSTGIGSLSQNWTRFQSQPIVSRMMKARPQFRVETATEPEPKRRLRRVRQPKPDKEPSRFIFPAYLQLSDRISPHMLAHEILSSNEDIEEAVDKVIPFNKQEFKKSYANGRSTDALVQVNPTFFDIYHVSKGHSDNQFLEMVTNMGSWQSGHTTKGMASFSALSLADNDISARYLIPRIVGSVKMSRKSTTVLDMPEDVPVGSRKTSFLQYFVQSVPEFEDRRVPPDEGKLDIPDDTKYRGDKNAHIGVSYVYQESPLQKDIFSAFLFNSCYVSVMAGSECGTNNDEDQAYEAEVWNYFQGVTVIPDLQVKLQCLKRAYALLAVRPLPEYNRFPEYLVYAISLIYDKGAHKILNIMRDHYEAAAPRICDTIKNAISKVEAGIPELLLFLAFQNNSLASKAYFNYDNKGLKHAQACLRAERVELSLGVDELWVYKFLKAFCREVYPDAHHIGLFFRLMDNLQGEILMLRPVAGALLLIPTMRELFSALDAQQSGFMLDELSLRVKDKFTLKAGERKTGITLEENEDDFLISEAPLTMRMFFDYAVALAMPHKDISAQKLTFATYVGCTLIREIETFCGLLNSLQVNGDFIALADLYADYIGDKRIDYKREAAMILQGRDMCGISKEEGKIIIRKVKNTMLTPLYSHCTFYFDNRHLDLHNTDEIPHSTSTEKEDGDFTDTINPM